MKSFALYAFCFFMLCDDAYPAELFTPFTLVAAEEISEMETLTEKDLQIPAGQNTEWLGACVAARSFHRGDIIKSDEILCLGPQL
ncbi:MAG: hypothetical protein ACXWQO_18505 [Bdellovibrionota bacterium]